MAALYELEHVTKVYDQAPALTDLTLTIEAEVTAIIGYSGAGKTTLLKLLAGLESPSSGTIWYRGTEITPKNAPTLRRDVTMLFQTPLFFNQTVEENVAYGLRRRGMKKAEAYDRGRQVLTTMGLHEVAKRRAMKLSGGEQQRVALARALVLEPKVLLLDEPTSDLDPTNTRLIIDIIQDFARKAPVIIATHDFRHVVELADRIAVLIDGELRQYDSPHHIFYEPPSVDVAHFVGVENIFSGSVIANTAGVATVQVGQQHLYVSSPITSGEVNVFIRPENVILSRQQLQSSARNNLHGHITAIVQIGPVFRITLDNGLSAFITRQSVEEMDLRVGTPIFSAFKATAAHLVLK